MQPAVSILMPVYNGERFVESTLAAVLDQSFEDIEVIVTDNCSTDSTLSILDSVADERVRVVRNPRNLGVLGNFRRGFELSSGSFVKWIAADDYLDPGFLEQSVDLMRNDDELALVVGEMRPVAADRRPLPFDAERQVYITDHGELVPSLDFPAGAASPSPSERFRCVVTEVTGNLIAAFQYGLYRRSALEDADLFRRKYLGAEKVLFAETLLRGPAVASETPSSERVFHPGHFGARNFKDTVRGLDPDHDSAISLPAANQAFGYVRAIRSAPISTRERARCLAAIAGKVARPDTLNRLVKPGPENYFGWGR